MQTRAAAAVLFCPCSSPLSCVTVRACVCVVCAHVVVCLHLLACPRACESYQCTSTCAEASVTLILCCDVFSLPNAHKPGVPRSMYRGAVVWRRLSHSLPELDPFFSLSCLWLCAWWVGGCGCLCVRGCFCGCSTGATDPEDQIASVRRGWLRLHARDWERFRCVLQGHRGSGG